MNSNLKLAALTMALASITIHEQAAIYTQLEQIKSYRPAYPPSKNKLKSLRRKARGKK